MSKLKPFIRWAGGKQGIIKWINSFVPQNYGRYFEPFLGAGSLFFSIAPLNSYISDINKPLVNCYKAIKMNPGLVNKHLRFFERNHSEEYYYEIRSEFNTSMDKFSYVQASRFIYLVQSSFNGIYRVNLRGNYNVPFGKLSPSFPSSDQLNVISKILNSSEIQCHSYEIIIDNIQRNDFVYFDPPYPKINGTSNFQHYTVGRFPDDEQVRLADFANLLDQIGVFVLISNADLPMIRNLYNGWHFSENEVTRYISSKSTKHKVSEIVIKNY